MRTGEGWRGDIGKGMTPDEVKAWFETYDAFIVSEARMAQSEGAEMFAVGTELVTMERYADQWREAIAKVRVVYKGSLIYCANHSEENKITWWDALDYIGIDAYYSLVETINPKESDIEKGWQPYLESCAAISAKYGKPVIFSEIGYMSRTGTAQRPFDFSLAQGYDEQAQADCYKAFFAKVYRQPWFAGVVFWNWDIYGPEPGKQDPGYSPEGKKAEAIIRKGFSGSAK